MKPIFLFLVAFLLWLPFCTQAQNGLDTTFGNKGKKTFFLTTDPSNKVYRVLAAHPDSLQRITLISFFYQDNSQKIIVSRLLENGSPDITFASQGKFDIPFNDSNEFYFQLSAIDASGRIVFAGVTDGLFPDIVLSRFLSNGKPDTTFSKDGYARFNWTEAGDYVNTLRIQSDGKILLSGTASAGTFADFTLMRLLPNGDPDSSFYGNGIRFIDIVMQDQNPVLEQLNNGKYLLAGAYLSMDSAGLALAQLNPDGTIDSLFGNKGIHTWTYGRGDHYFISLHSTGDGNYLGVIKKPGEGDTYRVIKINSNGSLDANFGANGSNAHLLSPLVLIPDSNTGYFVSINQKVIRFNYAGVHDVSFGNEIPTVPDYNFLSHSPESFLDFYLRMPDRSFRAFGTKGFPNQEGHLGIGIITAFTKTGKFQYTFADSGVLEIVTQGSKVLVPMKILATQSVSGKGILSVARVGNEFQEKLCLFKLNSNGDLDSSFGINGQLYYPLSSIENLKVALMEMKSGTICFSYINKNDVGDSVRILQLDQNGNLLLATAFLFGFEPTKILSLNEQQNKILLGGHGLVRINTNGTVDFTFNPVIDIVPEMIYVNSKQQILVGYDSVIRCLDTNGLILSSFGNAGEMVCSYSYTCNANSHTSYLKPAKLLEDTMEGKYILSAGMQRNCPLTEWVSIGIKFTFDGKQMDTVPYYSLNRYSGKGRVLPFFKNSWLLHDYWLPEKGKAPAEKGIVYKLSYTGAIDTSFGKQGKLAGREAMYKITDSLAYLNYSALEPIDSRTCWWVQNYNDSLYLNKISVQDPTPVINFTADSTMLSHPSNVRLQSICNYPVKQYNWQITPHNGGVYSFANGTDSSFARPQLWIAHVGLYDVSLNCQLADTLLKLTKTGFINYLNNTIKPSVYSEKEITIYPNPSSAFVYIQSNVNEKISRLECFNIQGEKVQEMQVTDSGILTYELPKDAGIYLLHLIFKDGSGVYKRIQRN